MAERIETEGPDSLYRRPFQILFGARIMNYLFYLCSSCVYSYRSWLSKKARRPWLVILLFFLSGTFFTIFMRRLVSPDTYSKISLILTPSMIVVLILVFFALLEANRFLKRWYDKMMEK